MITGGRRVGMGACGGAAPAGGSRRVYTYLGFLSVPGGYNVHSYRGIAFSIIFEPFPICRASIACFIVAFGCSTAASAGGWADGGCGGAALASAVGGGFAMAAGGDGALAAGGAGTLVLSLIAAGGGGAFNGQER